MDIEKELSSIALNITEPQYRTMPELSYSTLSTYEKGGFDSLDHLFDKIESPSLTFGSVVDTIITGGEDEFKANFVVLDIALSDGGISIAEKLKEMQLPYPTFDDIPIYIISQAAKDVGFWKADKWDSRRYAEVLKTGNIADYYNVIVCNDRTIINKTTYQEALACIRALHESPATSPYFADNDVFSPVKRYYQLKFKAVLDGVGFRCMADLLVVNYEKKIIYPVDLKTSGKSEWRFEDSFLQWNYMIQARLYWRIIRDNLDRDPYFKDFKLMPYRFIVVNKNTLVPLIWEFPLTESIGTLIDDKGNEYRDPVVIGKELRGYLDLRPRVPSEITYTGINTIKCLTKKQSK